MDQKFNSFEDQIIAVADYIIGRLNDDHGLLTFISKNLSWGIFKTAFENTLPDESLQFYDYIFEQMKKNSYVCPEPELMLFTIIELVGSTCYSCILYGQPAKHEKAAVPEEDYSEELADYDDSEDDGPPWDEDDTESEDNE